MQKSDFKVLTYNHVIIIKAIALYGCQGEKIEVLDCSVCPFSLTNAVNKENCVINGYNIDENVTKQACESFIDLYYQQNQQNQIIPDLSSCA